MNLVKQEPVAAAGVATVGAWVLCRFLFHLSPSETNQLVGGTGALALTAARRAVTPLTDLTSLSRSVLRLTALLLETTTVAPVAVAPADKAVLNQAAEIVDHAAEGPAA